QTYAGFLNDVDRAQRAANREDLRLVAVGQRPQYLHVIFRAVLCHASINSLASNLPSDLLTALARDRVWSPTHALAYARRLSNGWPLADALATLAAALPEAVLSSCLAAMGDISDEQARCEAVVALTPYVTAFLIHDVVATVNQFKDDAYKAEILVCLS